MEHRIELAGNLVRYSWDSSVEWELPLSSIRVIGEMTNNHGPYLDDYFFCFAVDEKTLYEASFYSDGRDQFLASLSALLGYDLCPQLCASTEFASNVMWPPALAGKPMFLFTPVPPKWRILRWSKFFWTTWQTLSPDVLAELDGDRVR